MTYLWQMTLLGGICTLLLLAAKPVILKKSGGKWYCGLWILVLIAYLLPYKLVFFAHRVEVVNEGVFPLPAIDLPEMQTDIGGAVLPMETAVSTAEYSFLDIRMVVYGIGIAGFLLYYLVSYIFLQIRIHRQAKEIYCPVLDEVRNELHIAGKIVLKTDAHIQTPLFLGILQPTILLPQKAYDKRELYFLLRHELTHYKSHHLYLRILALLVHTIHWFNPLAYVALRQIQEACEYACDEGVTENMDTENRLAYSYLLLQGACHGRASVFSLSFGGNRKKDVLKRRLTVIMEQQKKNKIQKAAIAVLAVGTLAVCSSFFDLKPIYAGAGTASESIHRKEEQGFLWTDKVKTEEDALSLAKAYVENIFHDDGKALTTTAEYHDGTEEQPEGWLIRFVSAQKTENTKEYAIWLTKGENAITVRQNTFGKQTKEVLSEKAWQKLLEDAFWVTEAKKFVENSPWQNEKVMDVQVTSPKGQRKQEEVCVSVDTASGAKYMLSFHPWKALGEVQYCPPMQVEYQSAVKPKGLLWTDKVETKEDAIVFAQQYVENVFHGDAKSLVATAEYHDGKDNSVQPKGWLIRLSDPKQKGNTREYAVWLEDEGSQVTARQKSLQTKAHSLSEEGKPIHEQSKEERDALLQDKFWVEEAKQIVKNSTLQKENVVNASIVPQQKYDILVEVDTKSGAKYLVSFHPWKELSAVKYCPAVKQNTQNLENQLAAAIADVYDVEQANINMKTDKKGTPAVYITTKSKQPLKREAVKNIQQFVADSTKGVKAEDVAVYCNEKRTFSVKQGKNGEQPYLLTMTEEGTNGNETSHITIQEGQPMLVKQENIPSGFPVAGKVSKAFDGKKHLGIDIDTHGKALPIQAVAGGVVKEADMDNVLGHYVVIDHGNGFVTKYAHNTKNLVKAGDAVEKGSEIALAGKTGMATGIHCHYEVWKNGVSQNPNDYQ